MTRDELIKHAASVIHAGRYAKADEPTAVDEFIAAGLAEAGLLADPEQHAHPACVPPTGSEEWGLAKHLSYDLMAVDLGFHSESSEPVAHLIRHGWRPAGHTELELEAKLDAARINASDAERIADGLRAERDALQARLDAIVKRITADPVACRSGAEHDVLAIIRGDHVAKQWRPRAALQGDQPAGEVSGG